SSQTGCAGPEMVGRPDSGLKGRSDVSWRVSPEATSYRKNSEWGEDVSLPLKRMNEPSPDHRHVPMPPSSQPMTVRSPDSTSYTPRMLFMPLRREILAASF